MNLKEVEEEIVEYVIKRGYRISTVKDRGIVYVRVRKKKGGKEHQKRIAPLTEEVLEILKKHGLDKQVAEESRAAMPKVVEKSAE